MDMILHLHIALNRGGCDSGTCTWIFDNPRNYRENYTRYFRTTIAWLPKSIDGYDDIVDALIDNLT